MKTTVSNLATQMRRVNRLSYDTYSVFRQFRLILFINVNVLEAGQY
jgi:hypothetical protein